MNDKIKKAIERCPRFIVSQKRIGTMIPSTEGAWLHIQDVFGIVRSILADAPQEPTPSQETENDKVKKAKEQLRAMAERIRQIHSPPPKSAPSPEPAGCHNCQSRIGCDRSPIEEVTPSPEDDRGNHCPTSRCCNCSHHACNYGHPSQPVEPKAETLHQMQSEPEENIWDEAKRGVCPICKKPTPAFLEGACEACYNSDDILRQLIQRIQDIDRLEAELDEANTQAGDCENGVCAQLKKAKDAARKLAAMCLQVVQGVDIDEIKET